VTHNKILRRLIRYFVISFTIFALAIGGIFAVLFSARNLDTHRAELTNQAKNAAAGLARMFESEKPEYTGDCLCEISHYLELIESITASDVWVVDYHLGQITFGCRYPRARFLGLPDDVGHIINDAFRGDTALCHKSFNMFFDNPYITVATPIALGDGEIVGVLLTHTRVSGINELTGSGILLLLYSMLAAVVLSVGVAVMLSSRFTLPLGKMKNAAIQIGGGDYSIRTGVAQDDEIGELAAVMDGMAQKLALSAEESRKLEKMRRDFVANISHELRTPITVMRGSLEALCDGVITEPDRIAEYHEQMLRECKHMGTLVTDLLEITRHK